MNEWGKLTSRQLWCSMKTAMVNRNMGCLGKGVDGQWVPTGDVLGPFRRHVPEARCKGQKTEYRVSDRQGIINKGPEGLGTANSSVWQVLGEIWTGLCGSRWGSNGRQ